MIEQFRRFLASTAGKVFSILASVLLVAVAAYSVRGFFQSETPESALSPTFVCSETGKPFEHRLQEGDSIPIHSPYSGKDTGYPAEACYWTKDGAVAKDPTWVILQETLKKTGPTFCPTCGRLVVGHNPTADASRRPPPTREEWFAAHEPPK